MKICIHVSPVPELVEIDYGKLCLSCCLVWICSFFTKVSLSLIYYQISKWNLFWSWSRNIYMLLSTAQWCGKLCFNQTSSKLYFGVCKCWYPQSTLSTVQYHCNAHFHLLHIILSFPCFYIMTLIYVLCYCTTAWVYPSLVYFSSYWNESQKSHHPNKPGFGANIISMMPLWLPLVLPAISNEHFHLWYGNTWNGGEADITPLSHQIKFKRLSKLAQAVMVITFGKCPVRISGATPTILKFLVLQSLQVNIKYLKTSNNCSFHALSDLLFMINVSVNTI